MSDQTNERRNGSERQLSDPAKLKIPPKNYQPSASEKNDTIDMPGMSIEQVRKTFMRPFTFTRGERRER